ncbi:MAG: tRNA uridine-5-carboxymethylaminomethyl(34) synthesis enzyme MnmG [Candidatus Omnitrophica bacterium]|nr:tRNA uridine-5-carboxymethylaminomethyl(34) synthesis enzyme MnmG [Candidatus Omnitrophota bacterium]
MEYDIIVTGAGHAGIEASLSSSRMGMKTLLITGNLDTICHMSCNPSIGGTGKGQLVKEIDALGGVMGLAIDATGIHFKMLNTGKGKAVWSPRAQADKKHYSGYMKLLVESQINLDILQGWVEKIIIENNKIKGIKTDLGIEFKTKTLIICTGTFLNGIIHIGEKKFNAGRLGELPSVKLSDEIKNLGIQTGRLKTGTPPRINKNSIDFSKIKVQKSDEKPVPFSFRTERINRPITDCYITWTGRETHRIIEENLYRSPLYTGQIKSTGPRYCPSIEVKIIRFPGKDSHQIFLEPEGLDTDEMYVNGFSTSIPVDVQEKAMRTIPGLENVKIMRYGYAIEYDFIYPWQLTPSLEYKHLQGLFFAGQINGTSGYEEAASQGIIAGINASLKIKGEEPFILSRGQAYVGVLIDDLITKELTEPYRIFTSRVEYRLLLRQDNADFRLMESGKKFGLIDEKTYNKMEHEKQTVKKICSELNNSYRPDKEKLSYADYLKRPEMKFTDIEKLQPAYSCLPEKIKEEVEIEIKYEGYIKRELSMIKKFSSLENVRLPGKIDYSMIKTLSTEAREKLQKHKPVSVGQAKRMDGISPSDITAILIYLKVL